MQNTQPTIIHGRDGETRVLSRILEERIQQAVKDGSRHLEVEAFGQHGIGGRLWISKQEPIHVKVTGSSGQRLGSLGFPGTTVEVFGPASDDAGWLNAGSEIIIHGHASNGIANAMAQGKIFIDGSIGSRGMTMTKANPKFDPPELWIMGSAGDYFAEFMAGGTVVVCGFEARTPDNVLGFRPCVGMVGGQIFFRGPHQGYSTADAMPIEISDEKWDWLTTNIKSYLDKIGRPELLSTLTVRSEWQLLKARTPHERLAKKRRSISEFRREVWDAELGRGGLIGDLSQADRSPIPLINTGDLRRHVPVWENEKYLPPCQSSCPSGIPVQKRWQLIRAGEVTEAINVAMQYTPFPATVCGHLCPNLCMEGCTRQIQDMQPIDITVLGKKGVDSTPPKLPDLAEKGKVAVIGGGPAGISAAWQLRLAGYEAIVFDMEKELGGKITATIPDTRIPREILDAELERIRKVVAHIQLASRMDKKEFARIYSEYDFVVLATGAQKPRSLPVPGKEQLVTALDFLKDAKKGKAPSGKSMVIIGAGNVGCDVATEAGQMGYDDITLIDVQEPASFGKEREEAEKYGAKFKWPCFTKEVTDKGVVLTTGELLAADTVIVSIGDQPDLDYLPETIARERGFVTVNDNYQTTDSKIFAIGDIVRPGLITHAIGAGRKAALCIADILSGNRPEADTSEMLEGARASIEYRDLGGEHSETIDYSRITLEYFDPRVTSFDSLEDCAGQCSSCGSCRDCGLCAVVCPQSAISRQTLDDGTFAMVSDPKKCIGCGFCANACPCGIWTIIPNTPMS